MFKTTLFILLILPILTLSNPEDSLKNYTPHDNPMSVQFLKKSLRKESPRLALNAELENKLRQKLKTDPVIQNVYKAIQLNAWQILSKQVLEREMTGRRLLKVSREMLYRINMLGMVYRIEKDEAILNRINKELLAVCNFSDWNPSHFLDVAEMSLAVSLAIDWTAGDLPQSTTELAKKALIEKAILPVWPEDGKTPDFITGKNNWNQVCNAGLIAASIVVAEQEPELASKTIKRSLDGIANGLEAYFPDGVYPEGVSYWSYGTSFSLITISLLESAFGTDFGISGFPGFMESALFRVLSNAPSGMYYNFADCSDKRGNNGDFALAWFAAKTGNEGFFEKERFLHPVENIGRLGRRAGIGLLWLAQFKEEENIKIPAVWKGDGINPVIFFTGGKNDPRQYYFAGKGGKGNIHHGNMDAGSFVFELDGVRWVTDPGNQSYHELESIGFDLWRRCQDCDRWKLLTKNNFGHSTITVNNELHQTDGMATIIDFKDGERPEATIDMTAAFGGQLLSAKRCFTKDSPVSLVITDSLVLSGSTELVTWQLVTTADVEIIKGGAILSKDGEKLQIENLSHPDFDLSIVSLQPAPLKIDRQIENLKRIELRIPAWICKDKKCAVKVRLTGV